MRKLILGLILTGSILHFTKAEKNIINVNSAIAEKFKGVWFDKETGNCEVAFYDSLAYYNNCIWKYDTVLFKHDTGFFRLKSNSKLIGLFVQCQTDGISIGESPGSMKIYGQYGLFKPIKPSASDSFVQPFFKIDSSVYSGYIDGNSRNSISSLTISVDDIISGKQNVFLANVDKDGFFSVKLPVYYPHEVWVRSSTYNRSVFLEPGKNLFQWITGARSIFFGELSRINNDLLRLSYMKMRDYYQMKNSFGNIKLKEYWYNLLEKEKNDYKKLDSLRNNGLIGDKAYQLVRLETRFNKASNFIDKFMYTDSPLYESNAVYKKQITSELDSVTAGFYKLNNQIINDPGAIVCLGYKIYINRIKYLSFFSGIRYYSTLDNIRLVTNSDYRFTQNEKELYSKYTEIGEIEELPEQREFIDKSRNEGKQLVKKYREYIPAELSTARYIDYPKIRQILSDKKVALEKDEKMLLKKLSKMYNLESSKKIRQFYAVYSDSIRQFYQKNKSFISCLWIKKYETDRLIRLQKFLCLEKGFATDIMLAQDYCSEILDDKTFFTENEISTIRQEISTPFIKEYLTICNLLNSKEFSDKTKNVDSFIREVPKTDADLIFDSIVAKYKGKVILVDFWATWCAPCRMAIENIKPHKEELMKKGIEFVYITNQTSPEETWKKVIAGIKGEHYRLSSDQWNNLSAKFNISGIPHMVLVNRQGTVVDSHFNSEGISLPEKLGKLSE